MSDLFGLFRFSYLALIAAVIGAGVAAATDLDMYKGYELPPYDVISSEGELELRRYEPHVLAEVTVTGNQSSAVSRGFQVLANYIFGGNATGERIAMTVPVGQVPSDARPADGWTVSFMMPARFDVDTLPAAKSEAIRFVETDAEELLVVQFSGFRNAAALAKHADLVTDAAKANGYTLAGAPRYFFYDGPMTPPWARRNEVAVPVIR
ncbi:MAG: heme-binding protein [Pseudomonadota bacterium]